MPVRRVTRRSYNYRSKYKRRSKKLQAIKKVVRLFSFSITGLVLFSVAFYLYTLTQNLSKPFAYASNGADSNSVAYDSSKPFNVLFIGLDNKEDSSSQIISLYLYHLDPIENKSVLFEIPTNITVQTPIKNDDVEISELYKIGNLMYREEGVVNVTNFVQRYFAIDVDGYIIYDKKSVEALNDLGMTITPDNLSDSIKYSYFLHVSSIFSFSRQHLLSDLNSIEAFKILSDSKNVGLSQKFIKLNSDDVKNTGDFDNIWQKETSYSQIHKERYQVTILNSTSVPGLAGWGARYIQNSKGIVLEVGNYEELQHKNVVYSALQGSKLLSALNNYFEVDQVLLPSDFKPDPFLAERSDIILVLGEKAIY